MEEYGFIFLETCHTNVWEIMCICGLIIVVMSALVLSICKNITSDTAFTNVFRIGISIICIGIITMLLGLTLGIARSEHDSHIRIYATKEADFNYLMDNYNIYKIEDRIIEVKEKKISKEAEQ